jgi:hypothetical protein
MFNPQYEAGPRFHLNKGNVPSDIGFGGGTKYVNVIAMLIR